MRGNVQGRRTTSKCGTGRQGGEIKENKEKGEGNKGLINN